MSRRHLPHVRPSAANLAADSTRRDAPAIEAIALTDFARPGPAERRHVVADFHVEAFALQSADLRARREHRQPRPVLVDRSERRMVAEVELATTDEVSSLLTGHHDRHNESVVGILVTSVVAGGRLVIG